MVAADLLEEALAAAGGLERWEAASECVATLSSGGRAFDAKWKRAMHDYTGTITVGKPHTVLHPYPMEGQRGIFEPERVRIETDSGELLGERDAPRQAFGGRDGLRRNLWWDHLDLLYFAGYALWNYLSFPFMLTRPGFELEEGEAIETDSGPWRRLDVRFPDDVPTHSAEQSFYFDADGLVRRHDYTAEPFGRWAKAIHYCSEHREFDGITLPTRRRVHPKLPGGRALRPLTLVWIDIANVELR